MYLGRNVPSDFPWLGGGAFCKHFVAVTEKSHGTHLDQQDAISPEA